MEKIFYDIINKYPNTCSIVNQKDNCITFARNKKFLSYLSNTDKKLYVIIPKDLLGATATLKCPNATFHIVGNVSYVDYMFTMLHNEIYKGFSRISIKIGTNCKIARTSILGIEGFKFANAPDGKKIRFIHTGSLEIGNDVEIEDFVIIHRGTIDSTIIHNGAKIAVQTNIGHNCEIGENTVIAGAVHVCGSVKIGKSCWIGAGTIIKNGVNVCDNVIIGIGSLVVKNIDVPGVYYGYPVEFKREYEGGFNF